VKLGTNSLAGNSNGFDAGGAAGGYNAPVFNIRAGSVFTSIRNNLFTAFSDIPASFGRALVSTDSGAVTKPGVSSADCNSGFNQLSYKASNGCVWLGPYTTGQVLSRYRQMYRPVAGNPLINRARPGRCPAIRGARSRRVLRARIARRAWPRPVQTA